MPFAAFGNPESLICVFLLLHLGRKISHLHYLLLHFGVKIAHLPGVCNIFVFTHFPMVFSDVWTVFHRLLMIFNDLVYMVLCFIEP